jgi:hypothetical protein
MSKSILDNYLTREDIAQLKADKKLWAEILAKQAINVVIVAKKPDGTNDGSRRQALQRFLIVIQGLLDEDEDCQEVEK